MAGIRTCDRESQVQRPNHYTTEPPMGDAKAAAAMTVTPHDVCIVHVYSQIVVARESLPVHVLHYGISYQN